ncbi:MAG: competence/damage-inducible protein A [Anaerolineae bacterium]|nr:competence/damage-inducible protein A [Anaerolineae bacterium]NIN98346.1 competence/damage-inducible protein A [Anaerolineae bacterium]NIQ81269.1 competence/damage-inducible protein A [Anaerolineae bacterium]
MAEQVTVEIIAVGNELLLGDVLDTNTNWLCKRITGVGGLVSRAGMVRDEHHAIVTEIRAALERGPQLIFTTGGLGPTGDDITLQAVAEATARPLHLDPEARSMVEARYEDLADKGYVEDAILTKAREKMAYLPEGAIPAANPVGAAPAVILKIDDSTLISLPGVPEELKGIYEETLQPTLKAIFGDSYYQEKAIVAHCGDESMLAPVLKEVVEAHPHVYVKSRARRFGPEVKILITLSSAGEDGDEVDRKIDRASEHLITALTAAGIGVEGEHNT